MPETDREMTEMARGLTFNLLRDGIYDWEDAFAVPDQDYLTFKPGIGEGRVRKLRLYQEKLNAHRRKHAVKEEHMVADQPQPKGVFDAIIIDGMEVVFISPEVNYIIKEMLDGLPMSKEGYLEHMRQAMIEEPEELLKKGVDFLNKYFHTGLILQERKVNDRDNYFLEIPKTTKIHFG